MKIGITCYPTYGGSGAVATELGLDLARRGHEVHFITYQSPFRLRGYTKGVFFHEVDTSMSRYPLFEHYPYELALASRQYEIAMQEKLDLLHVHYAIPHATTAFLAREMLAKLHPIKVITTLHGTDITLVGRDPSYLPITRFGIEVSNGVTAVSQWLRDETAKNFGTKKEIEVIPNFVDPSRFRKHAGALSGLFASSGEKLLCHVSNFRPVKRIMDVLAVFERVTRTIPSRLVMIGDGPDRSVAEAFCRDHHLREQVFFLGNVPNLEEVVGAADVFLLPSEAESFGMAALEAMASEVPVIGSRAGGLTEVVVEGETGYLLPVGDVEAMAARAIEILSTPALQHRLGRNGRDLAEGKFNVNAVVPRYREFYERVIG